MKGHLRVPVDLSAGTLKPEFLNPSLRMKEAHIRSSSQVILCMCIWELPKIGDPNLVP